MKNIFSITLVVVVQIIAGCGFLSFSNKQFIQRALPHDVFRLFNEFEIFDHGWQGTYLVVQGVVGMEDIEKFVDRFELVANDSGIDFIKANFSDYESVDPRFRFSSDPRKIFIKSGDSKIDNHRYTIYLDIENGGAWIVVFEKARFGR